MKKLLLGIIIFVYTLPVFCVGCLSKINGYKLVDNTTFQFEVDGKKTCFFAFYTLNPDPMVDVSGNGNSGDSIWYGYYNITNSNRIYEFPKPSDTDWSSVCSINAISFYDMNGDKKSDVSVIGSCNKNPVNYTVPFVFIRSDNKYVLDENVYKNLYGFIGLSINDLQAYIKSPKLYFKVLVERNNKL